MLRISTQTTDRGRVLKLEGALAGPWVDELAACWREATGAADARPIWIDLRGVCSVDEPGRALLGHMHRAGARFVACGCYMPELVREIAESSAAAGVVEATPVDFRHHRSSGG